MLDSLQGNDRGCDLGTVVVWGNTWSCCASLVCEVAGVWTGRRRSGVFINNISNDLALSDLCRRILWVNWFRRGLKSRQGLGRRMMLRELGFTAQMNVSQVSKYVLRED